MGDVRRVDDDELAAVLDFYRELVVRKVEGLTPEQATATRMPSGTTLLGIVAHLTEVERRWFEHRLDGLPDRSDVEAEFAVAPDATVAEVVDAYRASCERSRNIVARHSADDVTVVPAPIFGTGTVRWVMLHMIVETAQHAGHLDILRELTDGTTGFF